MIRPVIRSMWLFLVGAVSLLIFHKSYAVPPGPAQILILASDSFRASSGTKVQLTARVNDTEGNEIPGEKVTWSVDNSRIAAVNAQGHMTLLNTGILHLTASLGALKTSKEIVVQTVEDLALFEMEDLSDALRSQGGGSYRFLDEPTFSAYLLEFAEGRTGIDLEMAKDQVFYIVKGSFEAMVNGEAVSIETGSAVFVASDVPAKISKVSGDLHLVRTVLNADFTDSTIPFRVFTKAHMEVNRSTSQNAWNPFIRERSVIFGLYMLPERLGGDKRLVHPYDEINIVVNGSSTFQTDKGRVSVKPGSVVFVRRGNGHWFHALNEDIDILILWNK